MVRLLFFVVSKVLGRGYLMNVGWSVENVVNFYKYFFLKLIDNVINWFVKIKYKII